MPRHLPPEILREIFTYLDPIDNRRDFLSLCRVSRTFKRLAQPLLFRDFTVTGCTCHVTKTRDFEALVQFTRTVLSRTDLQNAVRQIKIRAEDTPGPSNGRSSVLLPDTCRFLLNKLWKIGLSDELKSLHATGIIYGEITPVLLLLCGNMKKLEIFNVTLNYSCLKKLVEVIFTDIGEPMYFSNLTSLDIRAIPEGVDMNFIDFEKLWPFLHLPRLQHFGVDRCVSHPSQIPERLSPDAVKASSISIVNCCIDPRTLRALMSSCKHVESLIYEVDARLAETLDLIRLKADDLIQALDPQKENLINLRVQLNDTGLERFPDEHDLLGSLTAFTNLKHLHVNQCCLGNTPELPKSPRTLVVSNYEEIIFDFMKHMVREGKDHLHDFETVTIKPSSSPCTLMLDILTEVDRRDLYLNEPFLVPHEEFEEQVRELEAIAKQATFKFIVDCPLYQEYKAMLSDEEKSSEALHGHDRTILREDEWIRGISICSGLVCI